VRANWRPEGHFIERENFLGGPSVEGSLERARTWILHALFGRFRAVILDVGGQVDLGDVLLGCETAAC